MIIGPRRIALIAAIVAVAATIILLPLIFARTAPNLEEVQVSVSRVTIAQADEQNTQLNVVFTLHNPTAQTATTSKIEYELFADGVSLGTDTISYEDIPPNGRPPLFQNGTINITDPFSLDYSDSIAGIYSKVQDSPSDVRWRVDGTARIESTLTFVDKQFSDEP